MHVISRWIAPVGVDESSDCRRGLERPPRDSPATSTFCSAPGGGDVMVGRKGREARQVGLGTPEDD